MAGPLVELIPEALDGERVDRVVSLLAGCSRSEAAALVTAGAVTLDGRRGRPRASSASRPARRCRSTSRQLPEPALPAPDPTVAVAVVHEDADVVVVDKPAGLVVHPGAGQADGTLVNGLLARYPEMADVGEPHRPGIVHRLDRDTSGLLVVARTPEAYLGLVEALSARRVTRRYQALVWGVPEAAHGIVDAPIGRSPREPTRMAVVAGGKEARTRYEVRDRYREPVVVLAPRLPARDGPHAPDPGPPGRLGHPVVGDRDYGGARDGLEVPRMVLHAGHLAFAHPVSRRAAGASPRRSRPTWPPAASLADRRLPSRSRQPIAPARRE